MPTLNTPGSGKYAAITGMAWMVVNNVLARLVAFVGQLILGWFLAPTEFGIYAIALSTTTAVAALRNGGSMQVLIQRGKEYETLAGLIFRYSLGFNVLAMVALFMFAPFAPSIFGPPELTTMIICIALSFPLGTAAMIFRSKLAIDNRFQGVATLNMTSTILLQASIVGLAYLGYGVFSLVFPLIIQMLYETVAGWIYAGKIPGLNKKVEWHQVVLLLRETRWVMLTAAMLALATTGDYLAVGLLTDETTVGLYFFGFQLVVAVGVLFSNGIEVVFPTVLAQLNSDRSRQDIAFLKALQAVTLVSMPACIVIILIAPSAIHLLWSGKWDMVASSVQILSICIPAWLVVNTSRTLVEARGLWRMRFSMMAVYGVGGLASASLGALAGDVYNIALAVTCFYVLYAIVFLALAPKMLVLNARGLFGAVCGPVLLTIVCAAVSMQLARVASNETSEHTVFLTLVAFLFFFALGNAVMFRNVWAELFSVVNVGHRKHF